MNASPPHAQTNAPTSRWSRLLFALIWAMALTACVAFYFLQQGWHADRSLVEAILPYLFGGFLGGWISIALAARFTRDKPQTTRFAFMFVCLAIFSIGLTTLIFLIQYQVYFSQWHAQIGSMTRLFQAFFTGLGSIYLMATTGLWPLLPWGLILLVLASFGFSRGWLPGSR